MNLKKGELSQAAALKALAAKVPTPFPFKASPAFINKARTLDPDDPVLAQVIPTAAEQQQKPGFCEDPLAEKNYTPLPGLICKYNSRALIYTTSACFLNCRFCFRRYFKNNSFDPDRQDLDRIITFLTRENISEVILSGGDPFKMKRELLAYLLQKLKKTSTIKRLRLHTRMPVSAPHMARPEILSLFDGFTKILVLHSNHPQEIDAETVQALDTCRTHGFTLFNQSVLLKNINDRVEILAELSEKLFAANVLPYYLHQLDPARGTAHFQVALSRGKDLIKKLAARLPGYMLPRYVRELPGRPYKKLL
ncbi:MAG TPA: KamA family radical SAM protein [Spirochaetota bacterium]|nr:KamA family radical SAM protein [Spirochaetota bacterium]